MLSKKILSIIISFFIGILLCESILRIKHYFVLDYDVEMWRYAKILKTKDTNTKINHIHLKNKKTKLQGVEISTNKFGQRDVNYKKNDLKLFDRSFLFLGSSITLGWGVEFKDTYVNLLNHKAKKENNQWIFVNGGVGNYNTERYINNYFKHWKELEFTDIVINFFVNDTETIKKNNPNFFLKNTHLGVVVWKWINSFKSKQSNENLQKYYEARYKEDYPGFVVAKKELLNLIDYCKTNNINLTILLIPDIHKTNPYPLKFINSKISSFAKEHKIEFLDLLDSIASVENKKLWNRYNDPHPNELAHSIFSESIYNFLKK